MVKTKEKIEIIIGLAIASSGASDGILSEKDFTAEKIVKMKEMISVLLVKTTLMYVKEYFAEEMEIEGLTELELLSVFANSAINMTSTFVDMEGELDEPK